MAYTLGYPVPPLRGFVLFLTCVKEPRDAAFVPSCCPVG
jgi:hypothetical protein